MQKMSPKTTSNNISSLELIYEEIKNCSKCDLGEKCNYALPRGNASSRMMIIGESAGATEAELHRVFTGPAGRLMDKIWEAGGMKTSYFYVTNVVKCRPVAKAGLGKENYTPKVEQRKQCRPYLDQELQLVDPKLIVTLGRTATEAILGKVPSMSAVRGKMYKIEDMVEPETTVRVFPMLHPAALLHAQKDKETHLKYKCWEWEDIQVLSKYIQKEELLHV